MRAFRQKGHGIGGRLQSATSPYDVSTQFTNGQVKAVSQDDVLVPASSVARVFDVTNQSGTVLNMQFDLCLGYQCSGRNGYANDTTISVYTDGSTVPNITFDVGLIGCTWMTSGVTHGTPHMSVGANGAGHAGYCNFVLAFPRYFATEFKVTITTNAVMTDGIMYWSTIRYTNAFTSPLRLKSANVTFAGQVNNLKLARRDYSLLNLGAGNRGWIVAFGLATNLASNLSYLEAPIEACVDGESTATTCSYYPNGGQDSFFSGFYFDTIQIGSGVGLKSGGGGTQWF